MLYNKKIIEIYDFDTGLAVIDLVVDKGLDKEIVEKYLLAYKSNLKLNEYINYKELETALVETFNAEAVLCKEVLAI